MYLEDDWRLLSTSVLHYTLSNCIQQINNIYMNLYTTYGINLYNFKDIFPSYGPSKTSNHQINQEFEMAK